MRSPEASPAQKRGNLENSKKHKPVNGQYPIPPRPSRSPKKCSISRKKRANIRLKCRTEASIDVYWLMQKSNCQRLKFPWALLFFVAISFPSRSQSPAPPSAPIAQKIKVYIVGTFHFDGSSGDVYKTAKVDMKTPEKQRELDDLVRRLAAAAPDRIFVEWTADRQGYVDTTYQLYLRNEFEPGNNEV